MAKKAKKTLLPKVASLGDLWMKARTDPRYEALAKAGAENLGGPHATLQQAREFLEAAAFELGEDGVVDEVNFVRDTL